MEIEGCRLKFEDGCMSVYKLKRKLLRANKSALLKDNTTDITLKIGDSFSYKAHKDILKENVPYFKAMFSDNFQESELATIPLSEDTEPQAVTKLMSFIYKGTFRVSASEVQAVFQLADQWGMTSIREFCSVFMTRELDSSNCLDLLQFSEVYCCSRLTKVCQEVVAQQFPAVTFSDAFLHLETERLVSLLQTPHLYLGATGEDFLVDSVLRWMHHDPSMRRMHLPQLQACINMSFVSSTMKEKWAEETKTVSDQEGEHILRRSSEHFIVFCGYLQSRTGPSCPRTPMVEKFDSNSNKFDQLAPLPESPSYGKAFNLFGKIVYLSVTVDAHPKTGKRIDCIKVWTYKPHLNLWQLSPEMFSPAALDSLTVCLVNDGAITYCEASSKIYVVQVDVGVCIRVACTDGDVHCDIDHKLPSLMPHLSENHSGFVTVSHQQRLYVIGGSYGPLMDRTCSDQVLCLSLDGTSWEDRAPMLIPRTNCSATVHGDYIYVTGGYGGAGQRRRQRSCEVYCVSSTTWEEFPQLTQSRSHHCSVTIGNKLYTVGGKSYACEKFLMMSDLHSWHPGARVVCDHVEWISLDRLDIGWSRVAQMFKSRCYFSTLVV